MTVISQDEFSLTFPSKLEGMFLLGNGNIMSWPLIFVATKMNDLDTTDTCAFNVRGFLTQLLLTVFLKEHNETTLFRFLKEHLRDGND